MADCRAGKKLRTSHNRGNDRRTMDDRILAVPIAGCPTPRQVSSIRTSIQAALVAKFAGVRSTHGRAIMIFLIGKSIRRSRPDLEKDGADFPHCQADT